MNVFILLRDTVDLLYIIRYNASYIMCFSPKRTTDGINKQEQHDQCIQIYILWRYTWSHIKISAGSGSILFSIVWPKRRTIIMYVMLVRPCNVHTLWYINFQWTSYYVHVNVVVLVMYVCILFYPSFGPDSVFGFPTSPTPPEAPVYAMYNTATWRIPHTLLIVLVSLLSCTW